MPKKLIESLALCLLVFGLAISSALSAELYSPPRGEPIRKELLDTIRPRVEAEMRTRVQFVVDTINIIGECAFVIATPQHKDGSPIAIETTRFARDIEFLDGLTTYSLMIYQNHRWQFTASQNKIPYRNFFPFVNFCYSRIYAFVTTRN